MILSACSSLSPIAAPARPTATVAPSPTATATPLATTAPATRSVATATVRATPVPTPSPDPTVPPAREVAGNPEVGATRFLALPCSGCHGATAQGGFGPRLAGTSLSFEQVRQQVRSPRDQMPAFDEAAVSDAELRDIYAWLQTLAPATATPEATLPPAEATAQALDARYPALDAATLRAQMEVLDEEALRVTGEITEVTDEGRYTTIRVRVSKGGESIDVIVLYDQRLMGAAEFPLDEGVATFYGVGADPIEVTRADGTTERLPHMQVLRWRAEPAQESSE